MRKANGRCKLTFQEEEEGRKKPNWKNQSPRKSLGKNPGPN